MKKWEHESKSRRSLCSSIRVTAFFVVLIALDLDRNFDREGGNRKEWDTRCIQQYCLRRIASSSCGRLRKVHVWGSRLGHTSAYRVDSSSVRNLNAKGSGSTQAIQRSRLDSLSRIWKRKPIHTIDTFTIHLTLCELRSCGTIPGTF